MVLATLGAIALSGAAVARPPVVRPHVGTPPQAVRAVSSRCAANLAAHIRHHNGARQLLTVVAPDAASSYATLTAWQKVGSCWTRAFGPYGARLGYAGTRTDKHEGDGSTPAGIFGFLPVMYGNAPDPGVHFAYRRLVCGDWWDEDSSSPGYNTFRAVPCSDARPAFDDGESEALWTETSLLPYFAVVNYNARRLPGKGSAIFLHAGIADATTGCVSLRRRELERLLDWMLPQDRPSIVIGTSAEVSSY